MLWHILQGKIFFRGYERVYWWVEQELGAHTLVEEEIVSRELHHLPPLNGLKEEKLNKACGVISAASM